MTPLAPIPGTMHSTHWTVRQLDLGRTAVDATHRCDLPRIRLEVFDGGGFTPSHAVWRLQGKVVAVLEAARA